MKRARSGGTFHSDLSDNAALRYGASMIDDDEPTIIYSPLRQRIEGDGTHIDVEIYRGETERYWLLEVIDEAGASTVYDDQFETDQAALDEVLDSIQQYGIRVYLEDGFPETVH